ncbi:MAG TPA: hypothetical protein VM010_01480 [Chitinophagaceae bacterium]|nr:hypothetical protein [Chitinophagaceae bacterium]
MKKHAVAEVPLAKGGVLQRHCGYNKDCLIAQGVLTVSDIESKNNNYISQIE